MFRFVLHVQDTRKANRPNTTTITHVIASVVWVGFNSVGFSSDESLSPTARNKSGSIIVFIPIILCSHATSPTTPATPRRGRLRQ